MYRIMSEYLLKFFIVVLFSIPRGGIFSNLSLLGNGPPFDFVGSFWFCLAFNGSLAESRDTSVGKVYVPWPFSSPVDTWTTT